ncbi:MAG: nucleoside monophosphate kinase [Candidatus Yanofskybacteria bacterium]|nr:nucleoside monophosphate kinase [Candidatus Yanofskybacteria bacterium]
MTAIIFIAPPGAGKGTQADAVAAKFGFFHFETSKMLEERLAGQENSADPEIREAWRLYKLGKLMTPSLVSRMVAEEIRKLYSEGKSVVFSGSFRTLEEVGKEMPILDELYGKENVKFFFIKISEEESVRRNSARRICKASRHPIPSGEYDPQFKNITSCPWDGSPIVTRELDKPDIIKERYRVFWNETAPALDYLKERGYKVMEINGEQPIEKVTEDIFKHLA